MANLGDMRVAQEQAGELSLLANADRCRVVVSIFSINHCNNMTVISKSEFVMVPLVFVSLTTLQEISDGHSTRHTILEYSPNVLIHIPPVPIPEASMLPTSDIGCPTNSFT